MGVAYGYRGVVGVQVGYGCLFRIRSYVPSTPTGTVGGVRNPGLRIGGDMSVVGAKEPLSREYDCGGKLSNYLYREGEEL